LRCLPRKMGSMPRLVRVAPWLVALVGLAIPLIPGGWAGWPYVLGWLVALALLFVVRPLARADRRDRIRWALLTIFLLAVPALALGGWYLVPAAVLWLAIEIGSRPSLPAIT
jgi:predicted PurR-regulated permease PerM